MDLLEYQGKQLFSGGRGKAGGTKLGAAERVVEPAD
jgi:hypothetical protein